MGTVIESNRLKYKINARDHQPPHVHVEGLGASVRINLLTLEVMDAKTGFSKSSVRNIIEFVKLHLTELLEVWNDYHE